MWSFQLIWYDGGHNKVLWHSWDFEGKARVCTPVERPGGDRLPVGCPSHARRLPVRGSRILLLSPC